jgi:hypothetical protein
VADYLAVCALVKTHLSLVDLAGIAHPLFERCEQGCYKRLAVARTQIVPDRAHALD